MKSNVILKRRRLLFLAGCVVLLLLLSVGTLLVVIAKGEQESSSSTHPTPSRTLITPSVSTATEQGTPEPLFFDDFADNNKGWSVGTVPGYTRILHDNALTLSDTNHTVLVESLPINAIFNDFSITVTFTLLQADEHDSVGLYLRGDSNLDHDYRVDIFGNSTYAISKEWLDASNEPQKTFLASPFHTSLLKSIGQQNTLTVVMKASTMVLQLNGSIVRTVTDTDYIHGQIALFIENGATSDGVTAQFHYLVIYPDPD